MRGKAAIHASSANELGREGRRLQNPDQRQLSVGHFSMATGKYWPASACCGRNCHALLGLGLFCDIARQQLSNPVGRIVMHRLR